MPATFSTTRRCPYCSAELRLADCPIVATSFPGVEFLDPENLDPDGIELYSGTQPRGLLPKTGWPVVALPPALEHAEPVVEKNHSLLRDAFRAPTAAVAERSLPSLSEHGNSNGVSPEDVPARACPQCQYPLPRNIDDREAIVMAVVGANRVGKTHFIAASLTEAYERRGLAALNCTEFVPDEATSVRFRMDYHHRLFREKTILDATAVDDDARFDPLVFNVTLSGSEPFSLVVHDISGETLGDYRSSARTATFLRAARGIVFLVDPREIEQIRDGLPDWIVENNELSFDQGALLASCLKANGAVVGQQMIPVAVTIAKADLLPQVCGELPFLTPAQPASENYEDLLERIKTTSHQVAAFLEEVAAFSLLGPAREYEDRCSVARQTAAGSEMAGTVTYHAVSALGGAPDADEQITTQIKPLNCVDPIAALLAQIARPVRQAG